MDDPPLVASDSPPRRRPSSSSSIPSSQSYSSPVSSRRRHRSPSPFGSPPDPNPNPIKYEDKPKPEPRRCLWLCVWILAFILFLLAIAILIFTVVSASVHKQAEYTDKHENKTKNAFSVYNETICRETRPKWSDIDSHITEYIESVKTHTNCSYQKNQCLGGCENDRVTLTGQIDRDMTNSINVVLKEKRETGNMLDIAINDALEGVRQSKLNETNIYYRTTCKNHCFEDETICNKGYKENIDKAPKPLGYEAYDTDEEMVNLMNKKDLGIDYIKALEDVKASESPTIKLAREAIAALGDFDPDKFGSLWKLIFFVQRGLFERDYITEAVVTITGIIGSVVTLLVEIGFVIRKLSDSNRNQ